MTSAFLTLTKDQGHSTSSKVTDVEISALSECFLFVIFRVNLLSTKHVTVKYTPHPVLSVRAWNPVAHVHTSLVETLHGSAVATHQSSIWHGDPIRARVTGINDHRLLSSYVCACSESLCAFICIQSLESVEHIELWDRYPVSIRNPTQISRTVWS